MRNVSSWSHAHNRRAANYGHHSPRLLTRCASTATLSVSEQPWLQPAECQLPTVPSSTATHTNSFHNVDRFDWRLRASSRKRKPPDPNAPKFFKRKTPSQVFIQEGEPFYDAVAAYKKRFTELIDLEQEEEEGVLRERLSTWSLHRLKEEGYCLTGLSAFWLQATQFGRPVASFSLGPGVILPDSRFENGTQVLVSRIDPLKEDALRGSIVSTDESRINVCFLEKHELEDGSWRLDVGTSNLIFDRMRVAVNSFNHDVSSQEAIETCSDRQLILQGTHLRDVFLQTFDPKQVHIHQALQSPDDVDYPSHQGLDHGETVDKGKRGFEQMGAFRDDMRIQSWARRYAEIDPLVIEGDPDLSGLNKSQIQALAMMIGQRICLIQGPPGTGKTKTIIEAIRLLKVHFEVPHPLLVCTYTNVAVDNLVEGLAAADVKPLRVGFGEKVRASLLEYTLDYQLERHPLQPILASVVKDEKYLDESLQDLFISIAEHKRTKSSDTPKSMKQLERLQWKYASKERQLVAVKARKYAIQQEMLQDVVSNADVVCTTCVSSACVALNVVDFPVVFLDEASMSTEPASMIPLMKGSRQVALIGDHKQLPPIIVSREAATQGLDISLFERLTEEGVVPSLMLDTQYRMHPSISRFPAAEFYNLSLIDGTIDAYGNVHPRLYPPTSQHLLENNGNGNRPSVIFLDHGGSESMKDRSRVNYNEAHIVASIVEDLLLNNSEIQGYDIGIIAPYVAQISLLTRLLKNDAKYKQRFVEVLGDHRAMQLANIEIKTVDGFEGREKEVIIFSTVRNNNGGHIGFLADRRRLNVGLTRAKRGLFVVGSLHTLKAGTRTRRSETAGAVVKTGKGAESWRRYAKFLDEQGLVVKLSGDTLARALYGNLRAARSAAGNVLQG